jgi:hypothetical protein
MFNFKTNSLKNEINYKLLTVKNKIMKKIIIIMLVFMFCGMQTYSQTATLQTLSSVSPGAVQVNLTMSGFSQQSIAFQWTVDYNPAILTYVSVSDWLTGITGVGIQTPSSGKITFVWGESDPYEINGVLCKINFTYVGPGCSNLTFSGSPTSDQIWEGDYDEYTVNFVNGQVCGVPTGIIDNPVNNSTVEIYPTLVNEKVNIKYNVPENGKITFGIYNMMGDEIQTITKEFVANTESSQEMNVSDLNSGIYFIRYQIETAIINTIKTEKITITR